MSIIVKGVKMPKSCSDCLLFVDGLYDANDEPCSACLAKEDDSPSGCGYGEIDGIDHTTWRMHWCPIAELPEKHGDLIDRDTLVKDLTNGIKAGLLFDGYEEYPNINNADDCVECVKYADAVIKTEGKE